MIIDPISVAMAEEARLRLAEVYWSLSGLCIATTQQLCQEIGLEARVVQERVDMLEGLGIIEGCGNPMHYTLSMDIPESHLLWLRRYELQVWQATQRKRTRRKAIAETSSVNRSIPDGLIVFDAPRAVDWNSFWPAFDQFINAHRLSNTQRTILFDSKEAAEQVAWTIRAEWDGVTGVVLAQRDTLALKTATELVRAKYCLVGDCCPLPNSNPGTSSTFTELLFLVALCRDPCPGRFGGAAVEYLKNNPIRLQIGC